MADAQDEVILARTLYGELPVQNLSEEMADDMVAAAQRRVERQMKKLEESQKLVNDGVIAQIALDPLEEELNMRRMNLNLAHSRSKLIGELAALPSTSRPCGRCKPRRIWSRTRTTPCNSMVHLRRAMGSFLANRGPEAAGVCFRAAFRPAAADQRRRPDGRPRLLWASIIADAWMWR